MAWMQRRERKKGVTWTVRYYDPAGDIQSKTFTQLGPKKGGDPEIHANAYKAKIESDLQKSTWTNPRKAKLTVQEWAEGHWLPTIAHRKPKTVEGYRSLLRTHVFPRFGGWKLDRIGHADIQAWLTGLSVDGLSPSRVRQAHLVLSAMLKFAVKDGRLARNPADGVSLPRMPEKEKRYLSPDEIEALARAAGDWGAWLYFMAYTGLRWGEMAALRVNRLDLIRGHVEVVESLSDVNGKLIPSTTKTHAHRKVRMPKFLVEMMAEHVAGKERDALVFATTQGYPLRGSNFRRSLWKSALESAGLVDPQPTIHDLRHTAASLFRAAGYDVKQMQRALGHKTSAVTLDTYTHLFEGHDDASLDRLDDLHRTAGATQPRPGGEVLAFKSRSSNV